MARASRRTKEARGKAHADGVVTLADIAAQSERSLKRLEQEARTRGRGGEGEGSASAGTTAKGEGVEARGVRPGKGANGTTKKMRVEDFEPLKLIGRGAFGA